MYKGYFRFFRKESIDLNEGFLNELKNFPFGEFEKLLKNLGLELINGFAPLPRNPFEKEFPKFLKHIIF